MNPEKAVFLSAPRPRDESKTLTTLAKARQTTAPAQTRSKRLFPRIILSPVSAALCVAIAALAPVPPPANAQASPPRPPSRKTIQSTNHTTLSVSNGTLDTSFESWKQAA